MLKHLLAIESGQISTYVILGVLVVAIIVMFVFSSKRRKKQEEEAKNLIDAVKPGNKVKTIGGICGIVVEVDLEENTFVLETGSESSGKCFLKFDRQAIYQTDAVVEGSSTPATAEETPAEAPAEEAPETEVQAEETPAEEQDKKSGKNSKKK